MSFSVSSSPAVQRGGFDWLLEAPKDAPQLIAFEAPVASAWRVLPEAASDVVLVAPAQGPLRVGWGIAKSFVGSGRERLEQLQTWSQRTLKDLRVHGTGPAPVVFAGFAFEDEVDDTWRSFGPAQGVLPLFAYVEHEGRAWLQVYVAPEADRAGLVRELNAALRRLHAVTAVPALDVFVKNAGEVAPWQRGIETIHAAMRNEGVHKVVLSRQIELASQTATSPRTLVAHLLKSEALGTRFLFAFDGQTFLGVTPERLVQVEGRRVHSAALAGSKPHGTASDLLSDSKELQEHEYVAHHVAQRLAPLCTEFMAPDGPELLALGYVTHLHTPMQGQLRHEMPALQLARALHPTPAVGGVPTIAARSLIREIEGRPRGWYTGGIGCVDATGSGEIWVALRCALLGPYSGRAFVGAGIVAASDPVTEWAETEAKGQAVLCALGVRP